MSNRPKHTPGPLTAKPDIIQPRWIIESEDLLVAATLWNDEPCACLLAAAYTSYDKHCGARAIKCAEDDLLGKALEALRAILRMPLPATVSSQEQRDRHAYRKMIESILAEATGKEEGG